MPDAPPQDISRTFAHPLPHLARALAQQRKIRIVAIGSSSTAGDGSIVPFPCRLELALRARFPGRMIDVLNRGVSGQEAPGELGRFETDIFDEAPSLVIWQVGTNAIYHRDEYDPHAVAGSITTGLHGLSGRPMDVILMDLQYAPALLGPGKIRDTELMVSLISAAAGAASVNLFPRFALMRRWCLVDGIAIDDLIDPVDATRLHMSDRATILVAQALDGAIAGALPAGG